MYDKIVTNQQISETWKALIIFAIRLKTQLSQSLKKHLDHKAFYQHTDSSLNHKSNSSTQKSKSSNFKIDLRLKKCRDHFSQETSADQQTIDKNIDIKRITCYQCHKKDHISKDCQIISEPYISNVTESKKKFKKNSKNF